MRLAGISPLCSTFDDNDDGLLCSAVTGDYKLMMVVMMMMVMVMIMMVCCAAQ